MIETDQTQIREFADKRSQRAKAILQNGNLSQLDEFTYLVPSQFDSNKKYRVTHIDSYSCECQDFERRCKGKGLYCKHIKAILLFEKLKVSYEVEQNPIKRELDLMIEKPLDDCCPYCSSKNIIKFGVRKTQLGNKQRYNCQECKKKFVLSPIPKIKGNAKLVCLAMDCFYRGLSYRDISAQFRDFYGLSLSHITIRNWVLKFSETLEKYAKTLQPKNVGNIWNADETMVRTKKGIRKTFRNWGNERKVKHTSILGRRRIINNNAIENHHTHQKEFQKVRRGINETQTYADGFKIFHNFVRKGVKDKLTPAERCGIEVQGNKWETMLLNSIKQPQLTGEQNVSKTTD